MPFEFKFFPTVVLCFLAFLIVPMLPAMDIDAPGAGQAQTVTPAPAETQAAAETHLKLCREAVEKGDADEAVSQGEKATALAPQSAEAFFWLAKGYEIKLQKTSGFAQLAPAKNFKSALEKAVELDPAHITAREHLFQYYLQAPPIAGGGLEKARQQAAEIAKLDQKRGHRAAALVFQKDKQWDKAEEEWKAFLTLDPKDFNATAGLAAFYAAWEKPDKAVEVWKTFLALDPQNIPAHMALGQHYAQMNQFDKAREILLAGLPFAGEDRGLHYQLGRLAALSGAELEAGLNYLRAYLEVEPLPGSPTWADAFWRMGNIHEKLGDKEAAAASYKKSLEFNPDHKNAKDSLVKLEKN